MIKQILVLMEIDLCEFICLHAWNKPSLHVHTNTHKNKIKMANICNMKKIGYM